MSDKIVHALAPRYCTDPAFFDIEKNGLLARTWQFAGHIAEIKNVGDYFTFSIAGENLFCIRGKDSKIRTFYNVCQHRAHQLLEGSGATRVIVCPYHAWTYELTGKFRAGPNTSTVENFDGGAICLTEVRTEIFQGFIFVNLTPDAAPMDEWYPGVRAQLREFVPNIGQLEPVEWIDVSENCNWKVSVENYSECYHCSRNHPAFSTGVIDPENYNIEPQQGFVLRHRTKCNDLDGMSYKIDPNAGPRATEYSSWYLWPLFSFQVYPGNVLNTYHWRPEAVDRVHLWRGWYSEDGIDSDTIRRLAQQDRATTVEEDISLIESVQRGLSSRGYKPGPLVIDPHHGVNSEHSIAVLHQWMRDAIEQYGSISDG